MKKSVREKSLMDSEMKHEKMIRENYDDPAVFEVKN